MTDDDARHERADNAETEEEEAPVAEWPIKGPATPQQALLAIALVFFLGVVIGFVLARTF